MSDGPRIRASPEDFVVEEIPLYPLSGEGEHTFIEVEKRMRTTEEVARLIARAAGVRPRDIGYAGRKDRVAVARQWFSVAGFDPSEARDLEAPGVRVLHAELHKNKLRTGHLRGNQFKIIVRGVSAELQARAGERARGLAQRGMPNRYGAQRFGRDGDNVAQARALLRGEKVRGAGDRRAQRFLLSALQSAVFNDVLEARPLALDVIEVGDVAILHASGGSFVVEDLAREAPRVKSFEISATGPIFGSKTMQAEGAPGARERAVFERWEIAELEPESLPRGIRLRGGRRPLRVHPVSLALRQQGKDAVEVAVTLPPGSYATVLVEELFGCFDG